MIALEWNGPWWAQAIVLCAAVVVSSATLYHHIILPIQRPISDRIETSLRKVVRDEIKSVEESQKIVMAQIETITAELSYNHGTSVKDTVTQILDVVTNSSPAIREAARK